MLLRERSRLWWDLRYLFGTHDDNWYLETFKLAAGRITGEISPQYFFLPKQEIIRIRSLVPQAKLIITLRNPVDWSWSFARMVVLRNRRYDASTDDQKVAAFFEGRIGQFRYTPALQRWRSIFPDDQLFIGFYDQLRDGAVDYFRDICRFLEIDPPLDQEDVLERVSGVVNKGTESEIPIKLSADLARSWLPDVENLCAIEDTYPQQWRADLKRRIREGSKPSAATSQRPPGKQPAL